MARFSHVCLLSEYISGTEGGLGGKFSWPGYRSLDWRGYCL